jgi:hypothetical protein
MPKWRRLAEDYFTIAPIHSDQVRAILYDMVDLHKSTHNDGNTYTDATGSHFQRATGWQGCIFLCGEYITGEMRLGDHCQGRSSVSIFRPGSCHLRAEGPVAELQPLCHLGRHPSSSINIQ